MKKPAEPEWSMRTSTTPRTDNLIADVMAKHPGESTKAQAVYYEAVHQELAPLARKLETELAGMRDAYSGAREDLADWKRRALAAEMLLRAADNKLQSIASYHGGAQATAIDKLREKFRPVLEGSQSAEAPFKLMPDRITPELLAAGAEAWNTMPTMATQNFIITSLYVAFHAAAPRLP